MDAEPGVDVEQAYGDVERAAVGHSPTDKIACDKIQRAFCQIDFAAISIGSALISQDFEIDVHARIVGSRAVRACLDRRSSARSWKLRAGFARVRSESCRDRSPPPGRPVARRTPVSPPAVGFGFALRHWRAELISRRAIAQPIGRIAGRRPYPITIRLAQDSVFNCVASDRSIAGSIFPASAAADAGPLDCAEAVCRKAACGEAVGCEIVVVIGGATVCIGRGSMASLSRIEPKSCQATSKLPASGSESTRTLDTPLYFTGRAVDSSNSQSFTFA